jgi:hypothetical protein
MTTLEKLIHFENLKKAIENKIEKLNNAQIKLN